MFWADTDNVKKLKNVAMDSAKDECDGHVPPKNCQAPVFRPL